MEKIVDGAIYSPDPRDFWSEVVETISPVKLHDFPRFNQWDYDETTHACTIVNALKDVCYNYFIPFSDELELEVVEYAVENMWYVVGEWWKTNKAMQAVRKFLATKDIEATYIRIPHTDKLLVEYLKAGYMIWCTFKGNEEYSRDKNEDWILHWTIFEPATRWHRSSMIMIDGTICIWDSYFGIKYNQYELNDFIWLLEAQTYFPTFYIRTKVEDMTDTPENIITNTERKKELIILVNSLSLWWKHLNPENQQKASELADYIRSME